MSLRRLHSGPAVSLCLILLVAVPCLAKDKPLNGIAIYDAQDGPAWVHLTQITLNGKPEALLCGSLSAFDKDTYKKLSKVSLIGVDGIERTADGVLHLITKTSSDCVVPSNLKLEKKQSYTASELAQMAVLGGKVTAQSNNGAATPPAFMPKTKVVFMDTPDAESADFLRAQRGNTIPLWQQYLQLQPSGAHKAQAQMALAGLITDQAEEQFAAFKKSTDYATLKSVRERLQEANRAAPGFTRANALEVEVNGVLQKLYGEARNERIAFTSALNSAKPGYAHLKSAIVLLDHLKASDPSYPNADALRAEVEGAMAQVEQATAEGESKVASDPDAAFQSIVKYAALAPELPRIDKIIVAAFQLHRTRGDAAVNESKWDDAIGEYQRALALRADDGVTASLKKAEGERQTLNDKASAEAAMAAIDPLVAQKQFVEAYERLEELPAGQRPFVAEKLKSLELDYAADLTTRATQLTRVHLPIRGKADEDAVRQAHGYLEKAASFETPDSEAIRTKLDLVSDKIAEYYLAQAMRSIEKPRGTGVALGYLLLLEGQRFKPDNEALRNAITKYSPEYDTRGKASIFVQFRDQTSRRDSLGFADQLSDTVAARLESAGFRGIKVLARNRDLTDPTTATGAQLANFLLVGDIIQHRVDKKMEAQRLVSHYRAGTREVKSPEWVEAKRRYDEAQLEYIRLSEANKLVAARAKKKEIEAAQATFNMQAQKLAEAKKQLDAIQETELQDIIQPYNYTKRNYSYKAVLEVAYKASEMFADSAMQSDAVKLELPHEASVLENVKPEDSDGVVEEGTVPDDLQLLAEAEGKTQNQLVSKLTGWVADVPAKMLAAARDKVKTGDEEAAAAKYIIYLNSTPEAETPERTEAMNFLREQFNITAMK